MSVTGLAFFAIVLFAGNVTKKVIIKSIRKTISNQLSYQKFIVPDTLYPAKYEYSKVENVLRTMISFCQILMNKLLWRITILSVKLPLFCKSVFNMAVVVIVPLPFRFLLILFYGSLEYWLGVIPKMSYSSSSLSFWWSLTFIICKMFFIQVCCIMSSVKTDFWSDYEKQSDLI